LFSFCSTSTESLTKLRYANLACWCTIYWYHALNWQQCKWSKRYHVVVI
jgi:hypothetical protein